MPGTVVPNLTDISLCESITGWTNVGTGTQGVNDPTVFDAKQGSYCCQDYRASAGDRGAQWDFGTAGVDFTGRILICWLAFSKKNFGANPMRFRLTDTLGNWSEWNMFTQADLPHPAWIPWVLNPSVARDAGSGTLDLTKIRYFSWRCAAVAAKVYIYWDAVRYGYGLGIKGGTSNDPAKFEDFVTAEATAAYGIVEKLNDVYFLGGQITIGSTTAGEATYFKDKNQVLAFKRMKGEPAGFYEIKGQGNATAATRIFFGEKSGTAGIAGNFINAPATMKWKLTMSDTNITEFGFYGCTFVNADTITGQAYSAGKEFLNTNFVACAEMLPNTGIVKNCIFISSPGRAIRISSTNHNVTNCNFIGCQTAVHHDVGGPQTAPLEYDYDALMFSGNTWDIENSASPPNYYINIDRLNGSNPSEAKINNSGGGQTTILPISVILTLTGLPLGSDVRILEAGTTNILAGTDNSGTTFNYSYNWGEYPYIDIVVLHLDYEYFRLENYAPGPTNASLPIPLKIDRWYLNP